MSNEGFPIVAATPAPREAPATGDEDMPLPHDPQTVFLGGLFLMAVFTVLYFAQAVILPIVIALVLKLLLQPLVRLLARIRIPRALGAGIAVLLLLGVFVALGAILSSPTSNFIRNIPELVRQVQAKITSMEGLMEKAAPFFDAIGVDPKNPGDLLSFNPGGLATSVAGGASAFASHLLETLLILFYLLVFGETFMRRLVEVLPRFKDKKQAVDISDTVERDISAYLLTITVINAVVGVLCGLVMWSCGVPGALVWGVVAFCLNYIPIIGPFAGVLLFGAVSLATLGASWFAIVPPALYLTIHFAEGEFFTPMMLAKRFTLNPVGVMIALVFWYWLWGVQGAILSVPLLAITKIISDRIRPLKAIGHMLEG